MMRVCEDMIHGFLSQAVYRDDSRTSPDIRVAELVEELPTIHFIQTWHISKEHI